MGRNKKDEKRATYSITNTLRAGNMYIFTFSQPEYLVCGRPCNVC